MTAPERPVLDATVQALGIDRLAAWLGRHLDAHPKRTYAVTTLATLALMMLIIWADSTLGG